MIIAALLGAEEFGFATAPLVVSGCIMMRVCHLDTCPVGVATQNPELRKQLRRQAGVRGQLLRVHRRGGPRSTWPQLGFRTLDEMVGRADLARHGTWRSSHWKASGLDLSPVLHQPRRCPTRAALSCRTSQDHGLDRALDNTLIELAEGRSTGRPPGHLDLPIGTSTGPWAPCWATRSPEAGAAEGLPDGHHRASPSRGSAGQSFGAFLPRGITLRLDGDANDYLGKGLSGGRIVVARPGRRQFTAERRRSSRAT